MNKEKIVVELSNIVKELGHFPTYQELRQLKRGDIENSLQYLDCSYHDLAIELGFSCQYPRGYWKNWDNLEKEIRKIIKKDKFPTCGEIKSQISSGAISGVMYFGGIKSVANKMGYKIEYFHEASDGHCLNSVNELIFDEFLFSNKIPHQVNGLIHPDFNFRYDFKIGDFYVEIWGFESNRTNNKRCVAYKEKRIKKETFYTSLNIKPISIECWIFKKSAEEMKVEFDKIIEKYQLKKFTSIDDSNKIIEKIVKTAYYWTEEKIIAELKILANQLNRFPKQHELMSLNRGDLKDAISRFGGKKHFIQFFT